jgi:hypothetical protein
MLNADRTFPPRPRTQREVDAWWIAYCYGLGFLYGAGVIDRAGVEDAQKEAARFADEYWQEYLEQ